MPTATNGSRPIASQLMHQHLRRLAIGAGASPARTSRFSISLYGLRPDLPRPSSPLGFVCYNCNNKFSMTQYIVSIWFCCSVDLYLFVYVQNTMLALVGRNSWFPSYHVR